jgi:alanine-alpha-ketoisovalerate/valine-pyruvate aminotransferase
VQQALADSFADVSCRYGSSRGTARLVDAIATYFKNRYGWDIGPQNIVIGPGSQMLCFVAAALYSGAASVTHGALRRGVRCGGCWVTTRRAAARAGALPR